MAGFEGLLAPQATDSSKTTDGKKSSSESSSTPKSGPSLFDSMLAQAGGKATAEGESGEQTATSQNQKTQTSQTGSTATQAVSTDGSDEEAKNSTGAKTASSGTSLFDKMVSQSKQQAVAGEGEGVQTQTSPKGEKIATTKEGVQNTAEVKTNTKNIAASAKSTYTVSPVAIEESASKTQTKGEKVVDGSSENQKVGTKTTTSNPVGDTVAKTTGENKQAIKSGVASQTAVETNPKITTENKGEPIAKEVLGKTTNNNTKQTVETKNNNLGVTQEQKVTVTNTPNTKTQTINQTASNSTIENKEQVVKAGTTTSSAVSGTLKENKTVAKQENTQSVDKSQKDGLVKTGIASSQTEVLNETKTQTSPQGVAVDKSTKTKVETTSLQKQAVDTNSNNKPSQTAESEPLSSDTKTTQKKSLADQLIAGATATAAQTKSLTPADKQGLATNGAKVTQNTTTTPLSNTNLTQKDTVLSSTQTDTSGVETKVAGETKTSTPAQATVSEQAVETKIDTKTTEQNIVDKKLENKSLDIKSVQKDTNLDNLEQNKVEKLATASSMAAATATSSGSSITNEDLANQLATIRDSAKGEVAVLNNAGTKTDLQNTSIKKDDLLNQGKKQDNTNNLLDKMVKESTEASKGVESDDTTLGTKDQFVQKDLPLFATAGYLHDQKRRNDIANMMKKYEGVQQAQNAKGVSDVKKSAATLELNATETEVVKEAVQKEESRVQNTREGMLKRLAFDNHLDKKLHNNTQQVKDAETVVAKSSTLTNVAEEKVVEVVVSNEAAQTIENRIIGARQSLRTMMSDVARQMAQNYRPPLTAFRINLNPSGLGNIAVMIKSEQNNGVNISLNMSNASTHDTLVDNQAALRAALTRNFENTSSFNLNFGMQQDSNNQSNQNQDGKSNQNNDSSSDRTVSANNNLNEESTEEVIEQQASYM